MAQCETCGASLRLGMSRCLKCGSTVEIESVVQPHPQTTQQYTQQVDIHQQQPIYSQVVTASAPSRPRKSKNVAAVFAFLLGGIGIHRFYLGNYLLGVLYLLFCWTYIPFLIGIIEGFYFLFLSEQKFYEKYDNN